jgi:RNA polymerase sigma factor (sigma-70 family)
MLDDDTSIGGIASGFPDTRHSRIACLRTGAKDDRRQAFDKIVSVYWKPVYKYVRVKWRKSNEDAKDLTQSFFARAFEKDFFDAYDPAKARFRTFLRTCLDRFISNQEKSMRAQKRGGNLAILSLDFPGAEAELALTAPSPDDCFEKEWIRNVFTVALETFRQQSADQDKAVHFQLFEKYVIDADPSAKSSYADLAKEFSISVSNVTNYLSYARREFRKIVLHTLGEITGSDEELQSEARYLLGGKFK